MCLFSMTECPSVLEFCAEIIRDATQHNNELFIHFLFTCNTHPNTVYRTICSLCWNLYLLDTEYYTTKCRGNLRATPSESTWFPHSYQRVRLLNFISCETVRNSVRAWWQNFTTTYCTACNWCSALEDYLFTAGSFWHFRHLRRCVVVHKNRLFRLCSALKMQLTVLSW